MREMHKWKDKVEFSLDNRQIFFLFFGLSVVGCFVFALGVMVGRRVNFEPAGEVAALSGESLALLAQPLDAELDHVAGLQVLRRRLHPHPNARRRAGGDDVARLKRHELAEIADQMRDPVDHGIGRAVLPGLAVHLQPHLQLLRVGDIGMIGLCDQAIKCLRLRDHSPKSIAKFSNGTFGVAQNVVNLIISSFQIGRHGQSSQHGDPLLVGDTASGRNKTGRSKGEFRKLGNKRFVVGREQNVGSSGKAGFVVTDIPV